MVFLPADHLIENSSKFNKSIKAYKKYLSKEDYKKEADSLREKVMEYQTFRRTAVDEIAKKRTGARQKLLDGLTPILEAYTKENGITLFVAHDDYIDGEWGKQPPKAKGMYKTIFDIPANLFDSGAVSISINFFNPPEPANSYILKKDNIFSFVMRDFMDGSGARKNYPFPWGSPALRPLIECKTNYFKPPKDR